MSTIKILTWTNAVFFFLIVALGFYSELNKTNRSLDLEYLHIFSNPLQKYHLKNLQSINIVNRMGEFRFSKEENVWNMVYPRHLPANTKLIRQIFNKLSSLKIKKIYPINDLNVSNFSLKNPLFSMSWQGKDERVTFKLGLINPLDNSIYFMLDGEENIYQVELPDIRPDGLDLMKFVNSTLFSFKPQSVNSMVLESYRSRKNPRQLKIVKNGELYFNQNQKQLKNEKVQDFFEKLLSVKAFIIIDNIDENLKKELAPYKNSTYYKIVINQSGQEIVYTFSPAIQENINELKVDKNLYTLVSSSNRPHPYIISIDVFDTIEEFSSLE